MSELVSIITSTYKNRAELIDRCIPSVKNQDYDNIEHIIVSDGNDNALKEEFERQAQIDPYVKEHIKFIECGRNWRSFSSKRSYGSMPRLLGTLVAKGSLIGYLDDDDEFEANHVSTLVGEIRKSNVDLAFSQMRIYLDGQDTGRIIGNGTITHGNIGTPLVIHKAELLLKANWDFSPFYMEDITLFEKWIKSGASFSFVPKVTVKYHKSKADQV